jgi:uridine kinase
VTNEGKVCFKRTWLRLVRRAVRDYNFRGSDVAFTLSMWDNVRRGEKLYISPFKNRADIMFDSALPYEVSVMKHYAPPLFGKLPEQNQRKEELKALGEAFLLFEEADPALVPKDSLLREFIGGGSYCY